MFTERNEAIKAGYAFLVGSDSNKIKSTFEEVNTNVIDGHDYFNMSNPFGDGTAAQQIVNELKLKNSLNSS